jgi:hypothetical protein
MKIIFIALLVTLLCPDRVLCEVFLIESGTNDFSTKGLISNRGSYLPPELNLDFKSLNSALFNDLALQKDELKKVKYYLLNGNSQKARAYLYKLSFVQTSLKPVIYRYISLLAFMDNDFEKTFEYLSLPELQNSPYYSQVCIIKILSEIVLNKTTELSSDWDRCQTESKKRQKSNFVWLETLVNLKLYPREGITKVPFKNFKIAALTNEEARIMLKLGLYLNQEEIIVNELPFMTLQQLEDPEIRELAGQIFFRTGALAKAYRFIEDLKSPNAESIKGNIYVLRTKYELAYAQFKVALEQKQDSQNSLERLLPLAWILGDWENGVKYAERIQSLPKTMANKLTLLAVFLMQKGDYQKATSITDKIELQLGKGAEIEVSQIAGFSALMQNETERAKKQSRISCGQYDLINCWVLFQLSQWDNFPLMLRREEKIPDNNDWKKLVSDGLHKPLKEKIFINQKDIEELDDKLIQLIPQT